MLGKPGEYLVKMNQDFVSGNEAFVSFLNLAQNPENLPLVNHCTAGKDRTGFDQHYYYFTRCTRENSNGRLFTK